MPVTRFGNLGLLRRGKGFSVRSEDAGDQFFSLPLDQNTPVRSEEAGDQFFSLPLDQNMPMDAGVGQSSPVRSEETGDQFFSLPLDQNMPRDAGVGQSSPVRLVDAGDQFLPLDQNTPLDQSSSSPAVGLTAVRVAESATPEVTEPTVKNGRFRFEGSVSLAGDGLSVRPVQPFGGSNCPEVV
ncbi:hypothetical protein SLA2020_364940 [Shorea laevis]